MMRARLVILFLVLSCIRADAWSYDSRYAETYLQYVPLVADLGMGLVGVNAEHGMLNRTFALGMAYGLEAIVVNAVLKETVREERPDGRGFNSFPSGHTATAFLGAELVRREYGWGWGAGAYAVATSVGVMRVCHQRHWWWDVCAGAGIGILCANAGYLLAGPVMNLFGLEDKGIVVAPSVDPVSGTLCAQLSYRF